MAIQTNLEDIESSSNKFVKPFKDLANFH